jgi:hypothetical protein
LPPLAQTLPAGSLVRLAKAVIPVVLAVPAGPGGW